MSFYELLLHGYIRDIEKSTKDNLIPSDLYQLCIQFYQLHHQTTIFIRNLHGDIDVVNFTSSHMFDTNHDSKSAKFISQFPMQPQPDSTSLCCHIPNLATHKIFADTINNNSHETMDYYSIFTIA